MEPTNSKVSEEELKTIKPLLIVEGPLPHLEKQSDGTMSQLTIEFPLGREAIELTPDGMRVDLGNGVKLTTNIPSWVKGVNDAKLQLVMEIEGSPPRAEPREPPVG